jgi:hypothetical protein
LTFARDERCSSRRAPLACCGKVADFSDENTLQYFDFAQFLSGRMIPSDREAR